MGEWDQQGWKEKDITKVLDVTPGAVSQWLSRARENGLEALRRRAPSGGMLRSCACTQRQLESKTFQGWAARMHEGSMHMHRKVWEYCFIAQALHERNILRPGRKGLGFGVGQEPLTALFADRGCEILATDLGTEQAREAGWVGTNEHAASLDALNKRGICPESDFRQRVRFRPVDMRHLPGDLGVFDFTWSSCSLEHLGSLKLGERFIYESLRYLRPGGIAVHTTEYNVSSDTETVDEGTAVLFRKGDFRLIRRQLRAEGHRVAPLDFAHGRRPADRIVDRPPYQHDVHLKLEIGGYTVTSFGLIIEKSSRP